MVKITSDKIRKMRTTLQLSQAQFAALLGLGVATLNRYENSTVPTPAHAELLSGLNDPVALARLLRDKEDVLGAEIHRRLLAYVFTQASAGGLTRIEELLSQEKNSLLNGARTFSPDRFKQLVLFFTKDGEWKTKLNKLLFYTDFLSFKELKKSLTGAKYVVGYYGPIPDNHESLYACLLESGALQTREEFRSETDDPVEKLVAQGGINLDTFSTREQAIIQFVFEFFKNMSAKRVAEYSHNERAYSAHSLGETISYEFAKRLSLEFKLDSGSSPKVKDSLWTAIRAAMRQLPSEEFQKLPNDGATNLDHYLYGAPKQKR